MTPSMPFAKWIEEFQNEGIANDCGGGTFCPAALLNRATAALFLLRAKRGRAYHPPAMTGTVFTDVPAGTDLGDWIEELAAEGLTDGCGAGRFCPADPVTRGEMAKFLNRAFGP